MFEFTETSYEKENTTKKNLSNFKSILKKIGKKYETELQIKKEKKISNGKNEHKTMCEV